MNSDHFFDALQAQHTVWVAKYFPTTTTELVLIGMCEEYFEGLNALDAAELLDAVGDATLFMVGFATRLEIRMSDVHKAAEATTRPVCRWAEAMERLARAYLKREQGVRGERQKHDVDIITAMVDLMRGWIELVAVHRPQDSSYLNLVLHTWEYVRDRQEGKPKTLVQNEQPKCAWCEQPVEIANDHYKCSRGSK